MSRPGDGPPRFSRHNAWRRVRYPRPQRQRALGYGSWRHQLAPFPFSGAVPGRLHPAVRLRHNVRLAALEDTTDLPPPPPARSPPPAKLAPQAMEERSQRIDQAKAPRPALKPRGWAKAHRNDVSPRAKALALIPRVPPRPLRIYALTQRPARDTPHNTSALETWRRRSLTASS